MRRNKIAHRRRIREFADPESKLSLSSRGAEVYGKRGLFAAKAAAAAADQGATVTATRRKKKAKGAA